MTPEQLFNENYRIAYRVIKKHPSWKRFVEVEDMRQIALAAVWEAAKAFDPSRGFKFVTLAGEYVKSAIRRQVEYHIARKRGGPGKGPETVRPAVRMSMFKRSADDIATGGEDGAELIDELTHRPDPASRMLGEEAAAERRTLLEGVLGLMPPKLAAALRHQFLGGLDREQAALAAGFKNRRCFQVTLDNWRRHNAEFLNNVFTRRIESCLV